MRVSVTSVEDFRWYLTSDRAPSFDEWLERHISRTKTDAMVRGTAFHKALETAQEGEFDQVRQDGYTFHFGCDADVCLPAIRELKGEKEFVVDGEPVTLVGKVDYLDGQTIGDYKLTRLGDIEPYQRSFQWRAYLDIFGGKVFRYHLFIHVPRRNDPDEFVMIRDHHSFTCLPYERMAEDVQAQLTTYVRMVREHIPEAA